MADFVAATPPALSSGIPSGRAPFMPSGLEYEARPVVLGHDTADRTDHGGPAGRLQPGTVLETGYFWAPNGGPAAESHGLEGPASGAITGWHWNLSGRSHTLTKLISSSVYRTGDRTTYTGTAYDIGGQPLRQAQIQFIGKNVQDNNHGSSTDSNGVFVAYLPTGDEYDAFAYTPRDGIAYHLHEIRDFTNRVEMVFSRITKQKAFGEGVFFK